jgi:hypothetical protein
MNFSRLLYTDYGRWLLSIVLGLGLATLFRKVCNERNCMVFHPPKFEELKENTYKYGDKCYKFKEKAVKCDNNKKKVRFAL